VTSQPFQERRRDTRVSVFTPLKAFYKLLPQNSLPKECKHPPKEIMEGVVLNLSRRGLMFRGRLPNSETMKQLREEKILIGLNIFDIAPGSRIKILSAFRWAVQNKPDEEIYDVGVEFREIASNGSSEILRYIIRNQMAR
jgi:hypothetical protein